MADSPNSDRPVLLHVQIAPFQLTNSLLLAVALACLALQVASLTDGINPDKSLVVQLVPGMLFAAIFLLFVTRLRKRGVLTVQPDRVHGRHANGVAFDVALSEVARVELQTRAVALRGAAGKLSLLLRLDNENQRASGIIWCLREYKDWPASIWRAYATTTTQLPKATRHFLGEDGEVSFGDIGFLVEVDGQSWFFPESAMVDVRGLGNGQLRMNMRPNALGEAPPQLEPSPAALPLARLLAALTEAELPADARQDCLDQLAENHGGCPLTQAATDAPLQGECLGHPVEVHLA